MKKTALVLLVSSITLSGCGDGHEDVVYYDDHTVPDFIYHQATGVDVPNDACLSDKLDWLDTFGSPDTITSWQDYNTSYEEYSLCDQSLVTFSYTEGTNYCVIEETPPAYCY